MQVTSALVLLAVIWFLILFCVLPLRMVSQGDAGEIVKGTMAGAPAKPVMRRKFLITTVIAVALWIPVCLLIVYGYLTVENFNLYEIIGPDRE
jgi:predicted secreted protein